MTVAVSRPLTARSRASIGALILSLLFVVGLPGKAEAVSCWGHWCSGKDPQSSGCSADAITTGWRDITGARLEIRWSPTCKTNWARYQQYPRGWYMGGQPIQLRAVQDTGYTQRRNYDMPPGDSTTTWTPMIYSPVRLVRAEPVMSCYRPGECLQGVMTGEGVVVTDWSGVFPLLWTAL